MRKIVITVHGGVVNGVYSTNAQDQSIIVDYDGDEDEDTEEPRALGFAFADGTTAQDIITSGHKIY
ncbi:MAG: hypothetical protein LBV29_03020 [Azoarcus sp.]|jgi:hypothetical protein|nr:hypothetical protein [Azoarcus sp.]